MKMSDEQREFYWRLFGGTAAALVLVAMMGEGVPLPLCVEATLREMCGDNWYLCGILFGCGW